MELKTGDGSTGLQHTSQLDDRGRRVGHISQEVREREGVERLVREGELLGPTGDEMDASPGARAADVLLATPQHCVGEVDTHDAARRAVGELEGDAGRTRGDVKDARRNSRNDTVNHGPPPTPVLTEREDRLEKVVVPREAGEQLSCETVRIR